MTIYWVTDQPFPASDEVIAEATQAGADTILHGIPPALIDVIAPGTLGVVDVPDPEPAHSAAGDLPVDLLLDATDPRDTSRIRRSEP